MNTKPLLTTDRAVVQRSAHRLKAEYVRLLEQLESTVRDGYDPKLRLLSLDKFRSGSTLI